MEKRIEILIINRINLIMEYVHQITNDPDDVKGEMNFTVNEIDGKKLCTFDIYVPGKDFEKHLNLGIPSEYLDELYKEFLDRIQSDETIATSSIAYMHRFLEGTFYTLFVAKSSVIKVTIHGIGHKVVAEYNEKYQELKEESKITK